MPAKKTTTKKADAEVKETVKAVEAEAAVKKAPAKKAAAKTTTAKTAAEKKETVKKETVKKETKAAATKKTAAKKTTTKKAAAKKEEKPVVNKKSVKDYEDIINWKKGEANGMDWLYIEVKADDLLTEVEAGVDNLDTVCEAILNCMLEGDTFIVEPKTENKVDAQMTVRYYCDNLSPERRKYSEVNA